MAGTKVPPRSNSLAAKQWYTAEFAELPEMDEASVAKELERLRSTGAAAFDGSATELAKLVFAGGKCDVEFLTTLLAITITKPGGESSERRIRAWVPVLTPVAIAIVTGYFGCLQAEVQRTQSQISSAVASNGALQVQVLTRQQTVEEMTKGVESSDRILRLLSATGEGGKQQRMLGISFAYNLLCNGSTNKSRFEWLANPLSVLAAEDPDDGVQKLARSVLLAASQPQCGSFVVASSSASGSGAGSASTVQSVASNSSLAAKLVGDLPYAIGIKFLSRDAESQRLAELVATEANGSPLVAPNITIRPASPIGVVPVFFSKTAPVELRYFRVEQGDAARTIAKYLNERVPKLNATARLLDDTSSPPRWMELWVRAR